MMPIRKEEFFMGVAELAAKRSKDPSTQVGAVIVNDSGRIIGVGYNGSISGMEETMVGWDKKSAGGKRYDRIIHAEINAILNSNASVKEHTMYVTHSPCIECCKFIMQAGIKKVFYKHVYDKNGDYKTVADNFELMGIEFVQREAIGQLKKVIEPEQLTLW